MTFIIKSLKSFTDDKQHNSVRFYNPKSLKHQLDTCDNPHPSSTENKIQKQKIN